MWNPQQLDELLTQLRHAIPPGVRNIPQDLENNFKPVLQNALAKLNLVTREEFDAQVGVLQRTRERLEALEKEMNLLEEQTKESS